MTRINTADEFFAAADEFEGRTGAARIRRFAASVERGETPSQEDMAALAAAFRAILKGTDPKKALALAGKKGRPEKRDGLEIALAVERRVRAGTQPPRAIGDVCNERDISEDTVRRALERDGERARAILEVEAREEAYRRMMEEAVRTIDQDRRKNHPDFLHFMQLLLVNTFMSRAPTTAPA